VAVALLIAIVALPWGAAHPAGKPAKVALLSPTTSEGAAVFVAGFRQGMRDLGHVEGTTYVLELRYAESKPERFADLARELVALKPDVIVTSTDVGISAVKRETRTIPIVMTFSTDPVGTGFVTSLAHPGGNITGLSNISSELSGKRLALLKEAVPSLSRVVVLWNPDIRGAVFDYRETETVARSLRIELQSFEVTAAEDLDRAFSSLIDGHVQALIVLPGNAVATARRPELAAFAQKNRLPAMYSSAIFVDAGGLMSYGPSIPAMYRRGATYVDKILKGAKPGDLPVERPTKFELVLNLKTARAMGLTLPQSVIRRADRTIE